jgi:dipeptidase D
MLHYEDAPDGFVMARVKAGGMTGGHSGVNINEERANAIRVLVRALVQIKKDFDMRLADISGGTAHNAIPRDAWADIFIPRESFKAIEKRPDWTWSLKRIQEHRPQPETQRGTSRDHRQAPPYAKAPQDLQPPFPLPHGVAAMSTDIRAGRGPTTWPTSRSPTTSWRSSPASAARLCRLHFLTAGSDIGRLAGAEAVSGNGYPSWQPDMNSPLLARCLIVYERLFGKKPHVEAIHAGLECGIIGDKKAGMDMISFGPTLKNPHSPDEKIHVESIGKVWDFLVELAKAE